MKKRTMAIILSAVSALTCLSPLSAGALGEISSESLESAVSEYYGSECREWKIYALDEFDGTNTRVFQSADNLRANLAAIYEGTSIYVSCDTPSKVIEYIEKNYPDYKQTPNIRIMQKVLNSNSIAKIMTRQAWI